VFGLCIINNSKGLKLLVTTSRVRPIKALDEVQLVSAKVIGDNTNDIT
jgi:hypothetical protein